MPIARTPTFHEPPGCGCKLIRGNVATCANPRAPAAGTGRCLLAQSGLHKLVLEHRNVGRPSDASGTPRRGAHGVIHSSIPERPGWRVRECVTGTSTWPEA